METTVTNEKGSHKDINSRLSWANTCYSSIQNILPFRP